MTSEKISLTGSESKSPETGNQYPDGIKFTFGKKKENQRTPRKGTASKHIKGTYIMDTNAKRYEWCKAGKCHHTVAAEKIKLVEDKIDKKLISQLTTKATKTTEEILEGVGLSDSFKEERGSYVLPSNGPKGIRIYLVRHLELGKVWIYSLNYSILNRHERMTIGLSAVPGSEKRLFHYREDFFCKLAQKVQKALDKRGEKTVEKVVHDFGISIETEISLGMKVLHDKECYCNC